LTGLRVSFEKMVLISRGQCEDCDGEVDQEDEISGEDDKQSCGQARCTSAAGQDHRGA
jgi:hypothetical protein